MEFVYKIAGKSKHCMRAMFMENMHCISLSVCIVASIMLRPYFNHAEIIFNLQKLQIFFLNIFLKNHYENILSRTKQIITADMITDIPKFILQQSFFVYLFVLFVWFFTINPLSGCH